MRRALSQVCRGLAPGQREAPGAWHRKTTHPPDCLGTGLQSRED